MESTHYHWWFPKYSVNGSVSCASTFCDTILGLYSLTNGRRQCVRYHVLPLRNIEKSRNFAIDTARKAMVAQNVVLSPPSYIRCIDTPMCAPLLNLQTVGVTWHKTVPIRLAWPHVPSCWTWERYGKRGMIRLKRKENLFTGSSLQCSVSLLLL